MMATLKKEDTKGQSVSNSGSKVFNFLKRWAIRLFHTAFLIIAGYIMILASTVMIPAFVSFLLAGLGFTLTTYAEIIAASLAGLFFTAWIFAITYKVGKALWRLYMRNIKATLPESAKKRVEELSQEK